MERLIWATMIAVAATGMMVTLAAAAPGQCTVSGYDTFACDVALDGGGLTFALPDGQIFAFALVEDGEGLGYLIAPDAPAGQRPAELGTFAPIADEPGCWAGARAVERFCVLVEE